MALTSPAVHEATAAGFLSARADVLAAGARSARTRQAYAADVRVFAGWCRMVGEESLPASVETVARFVADLGSQQVVTDAGMLWRYKPSTITRMLAGVAAAHHDAGLESPTSAGRVRQVMRGVRRAHQAPVRRMRPLLTGDIRRILDAMPGRVWPGGVKAARDRFAILAGYAGALRRSSVAAMTCGDVAAGPDGLTILLPHSKTDQEGAGLRVAIGPAEGPALCGPCAWTAWSRMTAAADTGDTVALMREVLDPPAPAAGGHLCRTVPPAPLPAAMPAVRRVTAAGHILDVPVTGDGLYRMLRARLQAAGIPPAGYGFHSLRAGFVTQARRNGATRREVRQQTHHASDAMVDVYDREYNPHVGNAEAKLGL